MSGTFVACLARLDWLRRLGVGALVAVLLCVAALQRAHADPTRLPNQFLPNTLHLSLAPESAETVSLGAFGAELAVSTTNSFVSEDTYTIDAEQREVALLVDYGIWDATDVSVRIPVVWRGGGVFDHTIRQWHEIFGLPDGERDTVQDDQYQVSGSTKDGTFTLDERGTSLGDIRLQVKRQILGVDTSNGMRASLAVEGGLPTARDGFGQDGIDLGGKLLVGFRQPSWEISSGVAGLYYSDRGSDGLRFDPFHLEAFISGELQLCDGLWATLGFYGGQQSVRNLANLPGGFLYLDTALRAEISDRGTISLLVRENPYPSRQSADVTVLLSYHNALPTGL